MLATFPGFGELDVSLHIVALIACAGFAAGWVDAVVGGGGLIQLPALLLVPGISPVQALATNKVGSVMGTSISALTFYRRVHPDMRTAIPMAVCALCGAVGGASLAVLIPAAALKPIIVVVLIGVGIYTARRPQLGDVSDLRFEGRQHVALAVGWGSVIGFYDGALGPGTGTFLVIALVGGLGYAFLPATAIAKVVNLATNTGALLLFIPTGAVVWGLGFIVGLCNIVGAYVGARMAVRGGTRFIRIAFLCVVSVLVVKLMWDVASEWH